MKGSYLRAESFLREKIRATTSTCYFAAADFFGLVNKPSMFFGTNKKLPPPTNLGRKLHKTEERYFRQKFDLNMKFGIYRIYDIPSGPLLYGL
jgi:hypothetical protein